jgi:hypothetical protein
MLTEETLLGAIFDVTNPKKVHDFHQLADENHERLFRTDAVGTLAPRRVTQKHFGTFRELHCTILRYDAL